MIQETSSGLRQRLRDLLLTNKLAKISEIVLVFAAAFGFIGLMKPFIGQNPVLKQAIVWTANILMLFIIWLGIKLRGETFEKFGLTFKPISWREGLNMVMLSLLVFVIAAAGFFAGSIIMANITGMPEGTDMTGYDYLRNNIWMLLLTLAGVYIVSSFGEEVIYRAFLINRISEIAGGSKKGTVIAVIFGAIIFGLVHYGWGPMGMVQTGFMGLALGICYLKLKRRLWILILAHAYMDTILMVQMYVAGR